MLKLCRTTVVTHLRAWSQRGGVAADREGSRLAWNEVKLSRQGGTCSERKQGGTRPEAGTMHPCTSKRGRDAHEEDVQATELGMGAQYEIARDPSLSGNAVSSDGGRNGSEGQDSPLNILALFHSEKRMKHGPFEVESNCQNPSPSRPPANVDVVGTDGRSNVSAGMASQQDCMAAITKVSVKVAEGMQSGLTSGTQFQCEICSVKSSSARDLEVHLAGKKHAKAMKQGSGVGNSTAQKIHPHPNGSEAEVFTPQNIQVLAENGSTHFIQNTNSALVEHHVSLDSSKDHMLDHTVINSMEEGNDQAILSKCCDSKDAKTIVAELLTSTGGPLTEVFFGSDPSGKVADNHGDNPCQPSTNGISCDSTLADGLTEKICSRMASEEVPHKHRLASLSSRSNSYCVAQALAAVSSMHGCLGLEELPKGSCCDQGAERSDSYVQGTKRVDNKGMVTMHTHCFSNLLHEVRVSAMEDALRCVGLTVNPSLPKAPSVSAATSQGEDLHCTVCRVEYGSKADLDLHLAGKKHASLVQRMSSRCQFCNINCNSEKDFKLHLSGKKHASKMRLVQKRLTF